MLALTRPMRQGRTEPTVTTRRARATSAASHGALALTVLLSYTFIACSALLAGPDECQRGESKCEGNDVMTCEPPCAEFGCKWHWNRQSCSGTCVNSNGSPFCAQSSTPDSNCTGRSGYCDANTAVGCSEGFAVGTQTCEASQVCALDGTDSLCALSKDADPRCADRGNSEVQFCDGKTLVTCRAGFALAARVCPVACVGSFCTLSSQPDPKCAGNRADTRYCDGDTLVTCVSGFAFERTDCSAPLLGSAGGSCWQFTEGATCGARRDGGGP